jgi:phosphoribosylformylglycinamidine synthase subunit PurQ / glutaminase
MIPIAHGEGRYYASDNVLKALEDNKQIIYTYCDENGDVNEGANPNGTTNNIAGIRNAAGNVFGMMPHPERACSNLLGNEDGRQVFKELLGVGIVSYKAEMVL